MREPTGETSRLLQENERLRRRVEELEAEAKRFTIAEEKIQLSEARLIEAQKVAHLGSWEWDVAKDVITASQEFYRLFDIEPERIAHFPQFIERLHPDDRERVGTEVDEALRQNRIYDTDYRVRLGDGGWRDIHARGQLFTDASGKPVRLAGTCLDITERKQAEAALRASEQRLRRFYESGLLGVIYWNIHGQITEANDKFIEMLGYTRAELNAGQIDWLNMTPPEYRHLDEASIAELKATGVNGKPLEKEYIRKDGTRIPVAVAGAMLDEDRINGVAFVQDITERKQAQETLRAQHAILGAILQSTDASVFSLDRAYRYTTFNAAHAATMKTIYGVDIQLGTSLAAYQSVPEDWQAARKNLDRALRGETFVEMAFSGDEDRSRRCFEIFHSPIHTGPNDIIGVSVYSRDVTERRRAEDEIRQLNVTLEQRIRDRTAQLEESNHELEAFSYSVSHDLRAPLRAIDGFTRILTDEYASHMDAEGQRLCSVVRENAKSMSQLIDDLLAFSRLGRAEMSFASIDMGALANAVFHELTTPESRGRIDFQVGDVPPAIADPTLMRQVWMNLLSNAIKFSSKQQRAVIKVSGQHGQAETVYTVQDDGAGFEMQYVDKLFGVFQRLHSAKDFEGTGVGLALVQRVIRRHGGRVWATGEPAKGAMFCFALQQRGA